MVRILLFLAAAGLLAGCGTTTGDAAGLRVVATTPVVADLVKAVAGDRAQVTTLIPANADPHEYEPRPNDIAALADADLVVRSGGDLDEWLADALAAAGGDARQLDLSEKVDVIGDDPHWWHDPRNAEKAVTALRDEFVAIDPGHRSAYSVTEYLMALEALDASIRACVDGIPAARRRLVTSHDALGYYARRYGFEVIGTVIPSNSTQSQPSAGEAAELVKAIRAAKVPVVFAETSVNPKVEAAIAREAGAKVGAALYADGLGPAGSDGATYLDAMRSNTMRIASGLGHPCSALG